MNNNMINNINQSMNNINNMNASMMNLSNQNFNNMNNTNFMNMSVNSNNINISNSNNAVSNINNSGNQDVFLTFIYEKNNKQCFITVKGNDKFFEVIRKLEEKYKWLKEDQNHTYYYQNQQITNINLSLNELGIIDNSNIVSK